MFAMELETVLKAKPRESSGLDATAEDVFVAASAVFTKVLLHFPSRNILSPFYSTFASNTRLDTRKKVNSI